VALRPIFLATHTVGDDLFWTNFDSGSIDEMYPLDLWPVKALRKAPSPYQRWVLRGPKHGNDLSNCTSGNWIK